MIELAKTYANCMEEIKSRIAVIRSITEGRLTLQSEMFNYELACIHLRKVLEVIAFGTLTANKSAYSAVYADYSRHWNPKRLLEKMATVHPEFYPKPIELDRQDADGKKHFKNVDGGWLTKEEFVQLYNLCGKTLHAWNPYSDIERVIDFGRSVDEWVSRIQRLLGLHYMRLAGSQDLWVVQIVNPEDGKVHVLTASTHGVNEKGVRPLS